MAKIEIDGKSLEVADGTMIIQAADEAGIHIPRFCYHEKLSIAANCRMCMVDVENAPKPLPACATPVMDGMKIQTQSERATDAQKGTMEFLLINHPLDCPICDQGGECPLQDQALGYGKDVSRFTEKKRVVEDKDIGPLIETAMTRCIHCTRCVRFGREIAGIMEMGGTGRGENLEIGTFLGKSVDSEVSGNMIDLCPVGALTSKPFRYSARSWEMAEHSGISPHDCVGANIAVQTLRNEVKRVVPVENAAVNDCWISDRDRFSYEAVNSPDRLVTPMLKSGDHWESTDWKTALNKVAQGLQEVIRANGADAIAGLISPLASNEEAYLFQKALRGIGCNNIDFRLRELDTSDDQGRGSFSGSEIPVAAFDKLSSVLLVGSNIRKEQPLLSLRLRNASLNDCRVFAINAMDYPFNFELAGGAVVEPTAVPAALARVATEVARISGAGLPDGVSAWAECCADDELYGTIAEILVADGAESAVMLGNSAAQHPHAAVIRGIANWIRDAAGSKRVDLPEGNGAGLALAGCLPGNGPRGRLLETSGVSAAESVRSPRKAYVLYGVDAIEDCALGGQFDEALEKADFVVSFSAFSCPSMNHANVILPIAAFTECAGSFVNVEGRLQKGNAAVTPKGEARPGWKVLRVMGNQLALDGFEYMDLSDVTAELGLGSMTDAPEFAVPARIDSPAEAGSENQDASETEQFHRISDVPIYRVDAYTRRAPSLQKTADNQSKPAAGLNPEQFVSFGLRDGALMNVVAPDGTGITISVQADARVPLNCIYLPQGYEETAPLGAAARVALEEV